MDATNIITKLEDRIPPASLKDCGFQTPQPYQKGANSENQKRAAVK
jgi:hypothetical protein